MERDALLAYLIEGTASSRWHWWAFHFQSIALGTNMPFVSALLDAILRVDAVMPGYARRMARAIVGLAGRAHYEPDYEQLLQILAEIHVAAHFVDVSWPEGTTFVDEPRVEGSGKNPEFLVAMPDLRLAVEVKAPALLSHQGRRDALPVQAGGRLLGLDQLEALAGGTEQVTLPRDNPVKDFLVSADAKFAPFHDGGSSFRGLLVVAWDDAVFEPITALAHPGSGLLTPNSFARDGDGGPLQFTHVNGVLVVSLLGRFKTALAENGSSHPFVLSPSIFAWSPDPARPPAFIEVPGASELPPDVRARIGAQPIAEIPGAEYRPVDVVNWIDGPSTD